MGINIVSHDYLEHFTGEIKPNLSVGDVVYLNSNPDTLMTIMEVDLEHSESIYLLLGWVDKTGVPQSAEIVSALCVTKYSIK